MTRLDFPTDGAEIMLLTDEQRGFTARGDVEPIDWLHLKKIAGTDRSFPRKAQFGWESGQDEDLFELAERADFSGAAKWKAKGGRTQAGNLKANTRYYWRVNGCAPFSFTTEDAAPRWIEAEGISNVRDMGAWRTMDGGRIRQGLIFRGGEMDTHQTITENGIRTMRGELGIKTDLDVRGEAVGRKSVSPLGDTVRFLLIPAKAYAEFLSEDQKETCSRIFRVFADRDSYPIYFHCWGGADRTGTIALMLQALLGMKEDDMLLDYELTSLSHWGERSRKSDLFVSFMDALAEYPGASINERAKAFLLSCGLREEEQDLIRKNLLEY